jgi:uncharacterized membrane protein HdeD (DUF308 family)
MSAAAATPDRLRRLYLVRFLFAAVWAATFAGVGSSLEAASITLLILYPAVDVAAAIFEARGGRHPALYANIAISALAAVGLAIAASDDIPSVLRVWGVWAVVAGLVQLIVALERRSLGGQWPMIISGGLSVLAGGSFLAQAGDATSMTLCAGYAALGGLFFLGSGVLLLRRSKVNQVAGAH